MHLFGAIRLVIFKKILPIRLFPPMFLFFFVFSHLPICTSTKYVLYCLILLPTNQQAQVQKGNCNFRYYNIGNSNIK